MATVAIKEVNGAGATATTVTSARFCSADTATPGTQYPVVKPEAGTNYSYWKTFYLNAETAPTGYINNVKLFSDGAIGWVGTTVHVGLTTAYTQSTGTQGTSGDLSTVASGASIASYTSASPLSVSVTTTGVTATTGRCSDFVVLQLGVTTGVSAGTLTGEAATWRYDET